jgi:hypothetical protein
MASGMPETSVFAFVKSNSPRVDMLVFGMPKTKAIVDNVLGHLRTKQTKAPSNG